MPKPLNISEKQLMDGLEDLIAQYEDDWEDESFEVDYGDRERLEQAVEVIMQVMKEYPQKVFIVTVRDDAKRIEKEMKRLKEIKR